MKPKIINAFIVVMLVTVMISCKEEDKYTIENKPVTGTFTYSNMVMVPLEVDPVTQQPLKARISFTGSGNISDLGELNYEGSFTFDFVAGLGYDFETTYTGTNAGDSFSATGSSQMIGNMVFTVLEQFSDGKGKFDKILGGGETHVELASDGSGGTGEASWTVTY